MSKISFKAFCVEYYASHAGIAGAEAYWRFDASGLLRVLDEDYEDLHGMSWEALMPMFDQYLGVKVQCVGADAKDHAMIHATLVSGIVSILAAHWHVAPDEAMRRFYSSKTALSLADEATGLYGQSALNIAGECTVELDGCPLADTCV